MCERRKLFCSPTSATQEPSLCIRVILCMKVLVEVEDSRAPFFFELMRNIRAKSLRLTPEKAEILQGLRNAVEDVKRHKRGEIELRELKDLIKEL